MRIAVVNETSAADKNNDIITALDGRGHTIYNAGMIEKGTVPELTYIHTGLISALLLNSGRADLVVGGCGTGQGFLNSVMQYPNVFCGLISSPLDAWLFAQINGGNCISLPLNFGYGWGGDVNLKFIFDKMFEVTWGCGYPEHRRESQKKSRTLITEISIIAHQPFSAIITALPDEILKPVLAYPGILGLLDPDTLADEPLRKAITARIDS